MLICRVDSIAERSEKQIDRDIDIRLNVRIGGQTLTDKSNINIKGLPTLQLASYFSNSPYLLVSAVPDNGIYYTDEYTNNL